MNSSLRHESAHSPQESAQKLCQTARQETNQIINPLIHQRIHRAIHRTNQWKSPWESCWHGSPINFPAAIALAANCENYGFGRLLQTLIAQDSKLLRNAIAAELNNPVAPSLDIQTKNFNQHCDQTSVDPSDALFELLALGDVRFEQRQFGEAKNLFDGVLALRPNDPEIRRLLVELSLAQDQPVSALNQLREMQQSASEPIDSPMGDSSESARQQPNRFGSICCGDAGFSQAGSDISG